EAHPFLLWGSRLQDADDLAALARLLDRERDDRGCSSALERTTLALLQNGKDALFDPPCTNEEAADDSQRWLMGLLGAARVSAEEYRWSELDELPGAPGGLSSALLHGTLLQGGLRNPELDPSQVLASAAMW